MNSVTRPRIGIVLLLLLGPVLAGCLADPESGSEWQQPSLGATAYYETETDFRLVVHLQEDIRVIRDAFGDEITALAIRYAVTPPGQDAPVMNVTEYLNKETMLIVRHHVDCVVEAYVSGLGCLDQERIYFGAAGLPGALGMSVAWATGGKRMAPEGQIGTVQHETFAGKEVEALDRQDCQGRNINDADHWPTFGVWPPVTAIASPLLVCSDSPFPSEFVPDMGLPAMNTTNQRQVLKLVSWTEGHGEDWPTRSDRRDGGEAPINGTSLGTLELLSVESPYFPVTTLEAHEFLYENNGSYASTIDAGAVVLRTKIQSRDGATDVEGNDVSVTHRVFITIGSKSIDWRTYQAAVTVTFAPNGSVLVRNTNQVDSNQNHRSTDPMEPADRPSISLAQAAARGMGAVGCHPTREVSWLDRLDSDTISGNWNGHAPQRLIARYSRSHEDPGGVVLPYSATIDSRTGAFLDIGAPADLIRQFDLGYTEAAQGCPSSMNSSPLLAPGPANHVSSAMGQP